VGFIVTVSDDDGKTLEVAEFIEAANISNAIWGRADVLGFQL
jgi:hypothetical protein